MGLKDQFEVIQNLTIRLEQVKMQSKSNNMIFIIILDNGKREKFENWIPGLQKEDGKFHIELIFVNFLLNQS